MSSLPQASIPYGRQTITEADISAVENVLRSPFLTQGTAVPAFEQAVVKKVGSAYGVAVNSATSALHIACLALGLGRVIDSGLRLSRLSLLQIVDAIAALRSTLLISNPLLG